LRVHENIPAAFEGLLAYSTADARAEEGNEDEMPGEDNSSIQVAVDLHDDVVGYIYDYHGARAQRRALQGAPRRFCVAKAYVNGQKIKAKAPARARQQKQSIVAGARQNVADARRVRMQRRLIAWQAF